MSNLLWFRDITMSDLPRVGGKNASLGEMVSRIHSAGFRVPGGFATTADAYRAFLAHGDLSARIRAQLADLDTSDVRELAVVAERIRTWIEGQPFPGDLNDDIRAASATLVAEQAHPDQVTWAVRSSATAEDLPDASFAGQQETFLNIDGIENVLEAIRGVFASLYTDRARGRPGTRPPWSRSLRGLGRPHCGYGRPSRRAMRSCRRRGAGRTS